MPLTLTYNGLGGKVKFSGTSGKFKTTYTRPGLLDLYPSAAAAYSLRKLSNTYAGSAIRVRRSSDNAEQNIEFVNGQLDTASLLTFCGVGNGFVTTWYDQSGNAKNLVQTGAAQQPSIVISGALITVSGKPYVQLLNGTRFVFSTDLVTAAASDHSLWMVHKQSITNDNIQMLLASGAEYHWLSYGTTQCVSNISCITISSGYVANTMYITSHISNQPTNTTIYRNGASIGSTGAINSTARSTTINATSSGGSIITMSEFIFYPSNQGANRTPITNNINSYYTIYTPVIYDTDAEAFFDRVTSAGGALTVTEQTAVNQLVISMKAAGIWTLMKAIYPMVGASAISCAQNLKSSSYTGTFAGGITYASTGITGNGTTNYMNTGLNIGTELTQLNSHASYYSRTQNDTTISGGYPTVIGAYGNSSYNTAIDLYIKRPTPGNVGGGQLGSFTTSVINNTETDARKFAILSRTSATSLKYYTNGVLRATNTVSDTTGFGNVTAYIGAGNYVNGTAQNNSILECAFASLGSGLTDTQASDFYTVVQAFQTTLGRQV